MNDIKSEISYKRRSYMINYLRFALSFTYEILASAITFDMEYEGGGKVLVNWNGYSFEIDSSGKEDGEMICAIVNELKKRNII